MKEFLLQCLKQISQSYFDKKDYISAGQVNRAIDVVEDYDGVLPDFRDIHNPEAGDNHPSTP
jgi:hypothetical protein